MAELKLQTLHQLTELKRDNKSVFLIASKSRLQNTTSYTQSVKGSPHAATLNPPHIGNLNEIYKSGDYLDTNSIRTLRQYIIFRNVYKYCMLFHQYVSYNN